MAIKLRRDTAANWTSANPVLASGEPAFETDTFKFKVGDGATNYTSLPYLAASPSALSAELSNRISADNALSARIDTVSNALSAKKLSSLTDVSITSPVSAQYLVYHSAEGKWVNSTIPAGSGSVTSAELLVEISNRVSADNALSTRIDTVSNALSAKKLSSLTDVSVTSPVSAQYLIYKSAEGKWVNSTIPAGSGSVTSAELLVEISNRTSADNALSTRIDTVSNALSAKKLSSLTDVSVTSPVSAQVLVYKSAEGKWANSTLAAGSGSVTSAELLVEISNRTSADNALSARIDTVSNALSVISQQLSVRSADHVVLSALVSNTISALSTLSARVAANSAQMTSADNAISAAVAAVSALVSTVASALSVRIDTQSQSISAISQQLSVLSARVASNSAQMTSADNAISNAVSILSQQVSVLSARVATNSAQMVSADAALSTRIDGVGGGFTEYDAGVASTTSLVINWSNGQAQKLSIVANTPIAAPTNFSAGGRYFLRIQQDGTGNRQPTWASPWLWPNSVSPTLGGANAADILAFYSDGTNLYGSYNNDLSAFQQAASVLSQQLSVISQQVSALSNQLSAFQAQLGQQIRIVSNTQSNATSTLAKISGLVFSVSADETWEINGMVLVSTSVAAAGVRLGVSGGVYSLPRFVRFDRTSGGQSAGLLGAGGLMAVSGTSTYMSAANIGGVLNGIKFDAVVNVASAGTFRLMYAAIASATASPVHIMPGSYLRAIRLK